ncbi:hypothetical protein ABZX74_40325 [Streptomyces olivaceoviridis]|uniref:hypothetical protein n=1 Tax=Streptomyces olivaceoviridis TaxID=1921 RepID=UPI00339DAB41
MEPGLDARTFGETVAAAALSDRWLERRESFASQLAALSSDEHGPDYWESQLEETRQFALSSGSPNNMLSDLVRYWAGKFAAFQKQIEIPRRHYAQQLLDEPASTEPLTPPIAFVDDDPPLTFDEDDAGPAADTLNHVLARLFLRLGPPPTPVRRDFAPVGGGDGGVQA